MLSEFPELTEGVPARWDTSCAIVAAVAIVAGKCHLV